MIDDLAMQYYWIGRWLAHHPEDNVLYKDCLGICGHDTATLFLEVLKIEERLRHFEEFVEANICTR